MTKDQELSTFLRDIKTCDVILVIQTEKNKQTRYLLGMSLLEQDNIIRNLSNNDYYSGPLSDYDTSKPENLWVFKVNYEGRVLYIKLKILEEQENCKVVVVISLHIDYL